jgi:predicted Zn-ribbon and HTH transcriptional regulator
LSYKDRLIFILLLLQRDYPLTVSEIIERIRDTYGISVKRLTIYDDLRAIETQLPLIVGHNRTGAPTYRLPRYHEVSV